jgi:hypothetical protein
MTVLPLFAERGKKEVYEPPREIDRGQAANINLGSC